MALTITIPGAVETTTGSTAPAVLTVGVGAPGQGVPSGGTTGQVLQKLSGVSYDTGWLTIPADYITSVTAPLAVTSGVLSVDLSAYLTSATAASTYQTLAGMSSYLTTATAASTYYLQTNPSGFQTAANVTTALSPYLLSATAASTYAVIAAGQPTAGTTGQVLTKNSGTNYDSSWATLIPGDRYLTTSTTSNTVSNGNKTFTIGTGLSYTPTQNITISYDAAHHMHGEVLTYNSGTGVLTVDINHHTGSGTYAAWVVNVGGVTPATSVAWGAITGTLSSQTDLQSALDLKLAATTAATTYYPLVGNPSSFLVAADITGKANLASPSFTGNVSISSSTGAALFIEQTGTGNILTLHDQASDTTFVTIDANGKVSTIASEATNGAGFNIAHGVAPTTPVNGDIWTTTTGLFMRQNGTTKQYVDFDTSQTINGNKTFSNATQTLGNSTATGTISVASGATISASTKTVNIGTGGVVGSTTTTTIGPVLGASTTSIGNTTAASTLNLATGATLTATTKAVFMATGGVLGSTTNVIVGPLLGASTIWIGDTTAASALNLAAGATTTGLGKTVNIGTSGAAGSTTNITIGSTTGTSTTTLQGTTNGVTAAADTNSVALATTAYVVGQAGSATPLVNGTAAVGTSLRYARQDHVHGTDTTRAPLASPTFTGTPTLPTGTIATTQTAGDNTTAVATTAFVTAAVPAFAVTADTNAPSSTTKVTSPWNVLDIVMHPGLQSLYYHAGVTSTSGAGAAFTNYGRWHDFFGPNNTVNGYSAWSWDTTTSSVGFAGYSRGELYYHKSWNKKIWLTGRSHIGNYSGSGGSGDTNNAFRVSLGGKTSLASGDNSTTQRNIGWKCVGGGAGVVNLVVGNGSTITNVATGFTPSIGRMFDWKIYSDGAGNVTMWINDTQVATTTAGPSSVQNYGLYYEMVDGNGSQAGGNPTFGNYGTKLLISV